MKYLFIKFIEEKINEKGIVRYYKYKFSKKDIEDNFTKEIEIFDIKNNYDPITGKTEKSFTSRSNNEPEISLLANAFSYIIFDTSFKQTNFKFTFEDSKIVNLKIIE